MIFTTVILNALLLATVHAAPIISAQDDVLVGSIVRVLYGFDWNCKQKRNVPGSDVVGYAVKVPNSDVVGYTVNGKRNVPGSDVVGYTVKAPNSDVVGYTVNGKNE